MFKYDKGGNLQYKKVYSYSAAAGKTYSDLLGGTGKTISYGYGVAANKDLLTSYNGSGTLEYDNYGNPQKWFKHGANGSTLGYTLWWGNVSNLTAITDDATDIQYTYKYNDQGIRTEKVVNGVVHKYYLQGEQIIAERYGNNLIKFYYDTTGVCGFNYNGKNYYYQKNIQGDILRIYNESGTLYAEYSYDAWGKCTIKSNVSNIATINPFRYRGYYFDEETGLYYLNARYYDPEIGRFISPDNIAFISLINIQGLNIYLYCYNNPIAYIDSAGFFPKFNNINKRLRWRIDDEGKDSEHLVVEYRGITYQRHRYPRTRLGRHGKDRTDIPNSVVKKLLEAGVPGDYFKMSYVSIPNWRESFNFSPNLNWQESFEFGSIPNWQEGFSTGVLIGGLFLMFFVCLLVVAL